MSLLTTIYKFIKPELTDSPPDITVTNENWDKLDAELKRQDDARKTHEADIASKLERVEFNCTPSAGYKITESKCYVIDKVAYLEIGIKKIDDTIFATGSIEVASIPHSLLFGVIVLNSIGFTPSGSEVETKSANLQRWSKKIRLNIASANAATIFIGGQYLIE